LIGSEQAIHPCGKFENGVDVSFDGGHSPEIDFVMGLSSCQGANKMTLSARAGPWEIHGQCNNDLIHNRIYIRIYSNIHSIMNMLVGYSNMNTLI